MQKAVWIYLAALVIFALPIALFHKDILAGFREKKELLRKRETQKNLSRQAAEKPLRPSVLPIPAGGETASPELTSRRNSLVRAIEKALPSVVNIGTERLSSRRHFFSEDDPIQQLFEDFLRTQEGTKNFSLGSGFVIDPSGLVVTNAHVVDRASRIHVTLSGGMTGEGRVLASDAANDIALLQLSGSPKNLPCSKFDLSGRLYLGETVIAAGNPFGLENSISAGVLSGTKRHFTYGGKILFSDILQTDAIVYPGSSGGPLIDIDGEVIGMNMSLYQNAPGIGFAIPAARILEHLASWVIPEKLHRLRLGLVPGVTKGKDGRYVLYVKKVLENTPAAASGIPEGAVVTAIDGKLLADPLSLNRRFVSLREGEKLSIGTADGKTYEMAPRRFLASDALEECRERLGLILTPLSENVAKKLLLPVKSGFLVSGITSKTADKLRRGDLLVVLDGKRIATLEDLVQALEKGRIGESMSAVFLSPVPEQKKKEDRFVPLLQYKLLLRFD
ncbi:MAG: trypsin-like peptidase domain-containing protein [Lentisphaeria bacterium]|nr:trypsin-like peptidase domain-containing protein [Lentisphaeria bacterium]